MKKAYLVTFEITTRVITEKEGDPNGDLMIDANNRAYNDVVSKACDNIYNLAPDFGENVAAIIEDTESPYGTFKGEE